MLVSMQERGLVAEEALFLDDMPAEVKSCENTCNALLIDPPRGLTAKEIHHMRQMLAPRLRAATAPAALAAQTPAESFNNRARGPVHSAHAAGIAPPFDNMGQIHGHEGNGKVVQNVDVE